MSDREPPENLTYAQGIRDGFAYLLREHKNVFVMGQGLWSPWYVGSTMTNLEHEFGKERVIDTPVSELACTGAALGASLYGYRPVVVHPRMDFMVLALDQIVNQAAKWRHMFGGRQSAPMTVRSIINRGGSQGAQHSQALHGWLAAIPGLRVVMPATPIDARDLLISSVLCNDPVVYIDDRWLYDLDEPWQPIRDVPLASVKPRRVREGHDVTLVACGYSTQLCMEAAELLAPQGISADVIDLRTVNPFDEQLLIESVEKTGRLCAVDGGWQTAGIASEIVACAAEYSSRPVVSRRVTLPSAPAPSSEALEEIYYPRADSVVSAVQSLSGEHKQ